MMETIEKFLSSVSEAQAGTTGTPMFDLKEALES